MTVQGSRRCYHPFGIAGRLLGRFSKLDGRTGVNVYGGFRHARRARRALIPGLLCLGLFCVLVPPPFAGAEVSEPRDGSADRQIQLPDDRATVASPPRRAFINGSEVLFQVCYTPRSIEELFRLYESAYTVDATLDLEGAKVLTDAMPEDVRPYGEKLTQWLAEFSGRRYFSIKQKSQGYFAGMRFAAETVEDQGFKEVFTEMLSSGTLDAVRAPVMVAAFAEPGSDRTTFIHAVPQIGFRWRSLLPNATEDSPGTDLEWLPRLDGSVRLFCFDEPGGVGRYAVRAYGLHGSMEQAVSQLEAMGLMGRWVEIRGTRRWGARKPLDTGGVAVLTITAGQRAFESMLVVTVSGEI